MEGICSDMYHTSGVTAQKYTCSFDHYKIDDNKGKCVVSAFKEGVIEVSGFRFQK